MSKQIYNEKITLDSENKNDFVVIDLFTKYECNQIIKYCDKKYTLIPSTIHTGTGEIVDDTVRNNKLAWLDHEDKGIAWFKDKIEDAVLNINNLKYKFDISLSQKLQFTKYAYDEFYSWHLDTGTKAPSNTRKLSVTVQLSDPKNYGGGELVLLTNGNLYHTLNLKRGQAVIFASYVPHMVTPVEALPGGG